MDSTVRRIRPKDYELSVVQDNLADAIQQVLDFLKQPNENKPSAQAELTPLLERAQGAAAPESFKSPALIVHGEPTDSGKDVVVIGDPASAVAAQVSANVGIYGNLVVRPVSGGGVALVPSGPGSILYTTNIGNSASMSSIDENGNIWSRNNVTGNIVTGNTVVSNVGFRASIYMGGIWNSSYVANTLTGCVHAIRNQANSLLGDTPSQRAMSTSGSILAVAANQAGPIGGATSVLVYKNYQPWIPSTNIGSGSGPYAPVVFPKGRYTFVRNDVITVYFVTTAAGNTQMNCHIDVEYGA